MRYMLLPIVLLFLSVAVTPQTSDQVVRAGIVKDAVGTIAGADKKYAEVILNDLNEYGGKIVAVDEDFFILEPKKPKAQLKIKVVSIGSVPSNMRRRIKYSDVIQIEGKDVALSFVPDPASSPYSTWHEVSSISRGDFVQIHRSPGGTIHGVLYRSTPNSLSLIRGNKEIVISAAEITKVYRVKGDTRSLATKILSGGKLGAEISEGWLPIGDPRASGHPVAVAMGSVIGASLFVLSIGKTQRLLVYSR